MTASHLCECGCGQTTRVATKTRKRLGHTKGQPLRYVNGHNKPREGQPVIPKPLPPNPSGLCQCGCGAQTPIAAYTSRRDGTAYREHIRFVKGHNQRKAVWFNSGEQRWMVYCRDGSRDPWARIVLRNKLGRELGDLQAHHVNGDTTDDRPWNLAALTASEHTKLHHAIRTSQPSTL